MSFPTLDLLATLCGTVQRGTVVEILDGGEVRVEVVADEPVRFSCDVLRAGAGAIVLKAGDAVLALLPPSDDQRGCILGVVEPYRGDEPKPGTVKLQAAEDLTLACGESSITLKKSGQILIKGSDVVTRARRTHKIKAGSVHIN